MSLRKQIIAGAVAASLLPAAAFATNGILPLGNGMVAHGFGGAGIGNATEAMSMVDNPALLSDVSSQWTIGASGFNPNRSADVGHGYVDSDSDWFLIPHAAYANNSGSGMAWGIGLSALGGMNTNYPEQLFGARVGVDLSGLIISPTLSYKATDTISLGISPLLGYEKLDTTGPALNERGPGQEKLPVTDSDSTTGWGVKVGLSAKVAEGTTLGLTYQSKINMGVMDNHAKFLFAPASDKHLDLPAYYGVGIASQVTDKVKLVGDVSYTDWSDVAIFDELFGWTSQTIYKAGVEYAVSDSLALRFGINHAKTPIPDSQVQNNILAPATTEDHITIGFGMKMGSGMINGYYARVLNNEQKQDNPAGLPAIQMDQNAFGLSYTGNL